MVSALSSSPVGWQFLCRALMLFGGALIASADLASAETPFEPPQALPSDRYSPIWERSPFELKVIGEPTVNLRSFAENLSLAGFSDVEGQITVHLKDKSSGGYIKLTNQTPSDSGIAFDKIVENSDPRLVKVSLRKGSETAQVGYAQDQIAPVQAGVLGAGAAQAASMMGRKPAAAPPGSGAVAPSANPAQDAANQQKSRRRIILPSSASPQSSTTLPNAAAGLASLFLPLSSHPS